MDAIEFISAYDSYVDEIRRVAKEILQAMVDELGNRDPHDLITTETWFPNATSARGLVWSIFIDSVNKQHKRSILKTGNSK